MLQVNNKDTRMTSLTHSDVSIVDFKQINIFYVGSEVIHMDRSPL